MNKIELQSNIANDSYTNYIYQSYDIQDSEKVKKQIPLFKIPDDDWNIGVIYGNSGSGKTTLINHFGGEYVDYEMASDKALISNFKHLTEENACRVLASVGLSSVPSWLKPYGVLSNGEKFRADMAMKLSKDNREVTFIDEFTSVVNRDVAKAVSVAVRKYIQRTNKKVIFSSCHDDIIPWLQPDWTFYPETGELVKKKSTNHHPSDWKSMKENTVRGRFLQTTTI